MVSKQGVITFGINEQFEKVFDRFLKMVDNDPEFKRLIGAKVTSDGERDKRYMRKKKTASKIRFVISKYVSDNIKKQKAATEAAGSSE